MEHTDLFICECNNTEHQMIYLYDDTDEDYPVVYVSTHLAQSKTFFERFKYAIKYLFGYQCKYGAFDEFIFKPRDWKKLEGVTTYLKQIYEKTTHLNRYQENKKILID